MQQLTSNTLLHGGTYKIVKVLGQGSFGITYLAEHVNLGRNVAIKEFFMKELNSRGDDGSITGMTEGSLSYNYAQKFRKEATNLARMEHPNIVRVTDSFEENGTYYYAMDYIDGQNLNDYIKSHPLTVEEATDIIKNVAEALIYMHDQMHMLHLDLKPGNIMRRSDGHIYLIDFGLSKHYDNNGAPETSTTIGLGTAGYAPIEQANQAKNGEFRPTIDVYALGATYYKLLTRKTPPPASDLVSDEDIIADELRSAGIPQNVADVVINAMMPSVKKRTRNMKEFINALSPMSPTTQPEEEGTIIDVTNSGYSVQSNCRKVQPTDVFMARKLFVEDGLDKEQVIKKLIDSKLSGSDAESVLKDLSSDDRLYENAEHILTSFDVDRDFTCELLSRMGHSANKIEDIVDGILVEMLENAKSEANKSMLIGFAWFAGGILLTLVTGGAFVFYGAELWGIWAFCNAAWNRIQLGFK